MPLALAVYALFTAARCALACAAPAADWFLALSVVADITLLMVTIWSFHLQYQAPPAIYLKAPTLMYAFILIALRTLRFEPRLRGAGRGERPRSAGSCLVAYACGSPKGA